MKYRKEAVHATNPEVLAAGRRKLVFAALAVLAVVLVAGTWLLVHSLQPKQNDAAVKPETAVSQPKTVEKKQATESAEHHAILRIAPTPTASPCLSTVICCSTRGFGTSTPAPTPRPRMARHSTLPACSSRCANTLMHPTLPYANSKHLSRSEAVHIRAIRYSIFRQKWPTPRKRGVSRLHACVESSWDQGADGIARLWDTLDQDGIAQTGSYKTEEDSYKPLVIDSPTGGGKLGLIAGTVSLNAQTPDYDWRVDRLRESGDPNHQADIDKAVAKAKAAREQVPMWWP